MKNFFNSTQYISKYSIIFLASILAVVTTFAVMAADVSLQSDINVKNVTDGATTYTEATNADKDDVVRFKVWYHVLELSNSGLVAKNVTIQIDFPDELSKVQTVSATTKGDNTNVVTDSATVNAPTDTSHLVYIPGSAKWQHNVGDRTNINYVFTALDDKVVTEGVPIVIGDVLPSYEYEGWVYIDAQIKEEYKPPEPVYECTSLTAVVDSSDRFAFNFTTKTKMSDDVSVNKYVYDFGADGESKVTTDKSQITKVYKDYGTYNSEVEVVFNVGDGQKSDICKTSVTINEPPVEPPVNPPTPELPDTGPASVMAGLFGTGALGYGAVSLRASRSGLRNKILGKE